jgi:hypothetical protein
VVIKTVTKRPIFYEGAALKVIGRVTDYKYYASGLNFVVATELKGYKEVPHHLKEIHPEIENTTDFVLQFMQQMSTQLKYLHQEYFHMDIQNANILYRPSQSAEKSSEFQLVDFGVSRPIWQRTWALREYLHGVHSRVPAAACLLKRGKPQGAAEYCDRPDVAPHIDKLCDGIIDGYLVGTMALRMLYSQTVGRMYDSDVPKCPRNATFPLIIEHYEALILAIEELKGQVDDGVLDMISQLVDLKHFNRTLVCPD